MPRDTAFPILWSVEELKESFVIKDANGMALAYLYFDDDPTGDR